MIESNYNGIQVFPSGRKRTRPYIVLENMAGGSLFDYVGWF